MKYIDQAKIEGLLNKADKSDAAGLEAILGKSKLLQRLSLQEAATLLAADDPVSIKNIFETAALVKDRIYGKRVVLFAPLYISNFCSNTCLYCAFNAGNSITHRKALTTDEIKEQVAWLLKRGHKRILMVSGESGPHGLKPIDYYVEAVRAIYSVKVGPHQIKRVNVNAAPLSVEEFKKLKEAGIGTYQLFQETYHEQTYRRVHPQGPKSDPDNRIDALNRAFAAGIDDVGVGVLYGLYDWKFETLAMLMHVEALEKKFGLGPHTISVPRIEPAAGVEFTRHVPYAVKDEEFKRLVAVLRLAVPYTGIILSTRETPDMRDELFSLGVSQVSAESRTSPGGYASDGQGAGHDAQFILNDYRSLDEVVGSLVTRNFIPSFCAACYRKERTGKSFMDLAKPGTIKGKCSMNALITLKEYLDDFASAEVKQKGYQLIEECKKGLDTDSAKQLAKFFADAEQGARDRFV